MLKKIQIDQLQLGMYVHNLDCDWMSHPFFRSRFMVKDDSAIQKIKQAGIRQLVIDTEKGLDCDAAATVDEVEASLQQSFEKVAEKKRPLPRQVSAAEEYTTARAIFTEANQVIRTLLLDARLGKQVELEKIAPITEKIVNSVFRNKDALISLTRIKDRDQYTFMHSVSVSGLMATFARAQGFEREVIEQIVMGSLLHDIGKMMVPPEILNKPDKLTDAEFEIMKTHVVHSREILSTTAGITQAALDVAAMHHERHDGTGYPLGLKGDQISEIGHMSSIVDVYDALTSVRCYKDAWEPAQTLKKLLEWSHTHFRQDLVESFIRCLGIYPVGSLVQLQSGLVGIVLEQNESDLLRPDLRIIYNSRSESYVPIKDLKLRKRPEDRIVQAISPDKYHIDLGAFI